MTPQSSVLCLGNPLDRGAWWATVHGVAEELDTIQQLNTNNKSKIRKLMVTQQRAHLCMKCSLGISHFFEEISSLSHSVVFLSFFALITEEGFLISPCYSLELCIQMHISFLFSFAFHFSSFFFFTAILHFFSMGMVLIPVSGTISRTSIHSSSGTLSDLVP